MKHTYDIQLAFTRKPFPPGPCDV
ncbi:hypothetical protein BN2475_260033 [Paraburkholderia ribeironis]|uniref:Uncharacterized protein n=1 Tax=Paraburkholderia ribeironis TaxID=1247936 RepID=A0A1N7RZR0_9BURK|nr:hypothetical protein BN2475_260033 [Paraburkholderia ribeironis]